MAIEPLTLNRISGVLILSAIVLALIAANSPLAEIYAKVHHAPIRIGLVPYQIDAPLIVWINQGLMTVFFVPGGLEIKHVLPAGHLWTLRRVLHP